VKQQFCIDEPSENLVLLHTHTKISFPLMMITKSGSLIFSLINKTKLRTHTTHTHTHNVHTQKKASKEEKREKRRRAAKLVQGYLKNVCLVLAQGEVCFLDISSLIACWYAARNLDDAHAA